MSLITVLSPTLATRALHATTPKLKPNVATVPLVTRVMASNVPQPMIPVLPTHVMLGSSVSMLEWVTAPDMCVVSALMVQWEMVRPVFLLILIPAQIIHVIMK